MLKNVTKKIISFCLVVVVCALCSFCVCANTNAVIYATDVTAKPNDIVKIEVVLDFNPGINTLRLFVDYSSEYFELVSSTDGEILGQSTHSKDISAKPYVLYWTNSSKEDFTKNGVLATLEFKVKKSTPSGGYPINLYFKSANDCINSKLSPITVELDNGVITVENEQDLILSTSTQNSKIPVSSNEILSPEFSSNPNTVSNTTSKNATSVQNLQSTQSIIESSDMIDFVSEQDFVTSQQQINEENSVNLFLILGLSLLVLIAVAVVIVLINKKPLAK